MERRMRKLGRGEAELALSDLQMIPELAQNPFVPRLFALGDSDNDGYMTARDLQRLLETFTSLSDYSTRCRFAFEVFDADRDGQVTAQDIARFLTLCDVRNLSRASIDATAEAVVSRHDANGDGMLSVDEFRTLLNACEGLVGYATEVPTLSGGVGGGAETLAPVQRPGTEEVHSGAMREA
ncbi:hypothetical protein H632_c266p0 [Helicosporidium sp. ATCC 50920]|nr:hypothetical protein H632_c266p0 [Helicosporidium sp. ATCC 50920]|eukprot:KDD76329.1 hypothetical protein H632_c266p0 [Helicosporidium sp. ATCC 50920]